MFVDKSIKAIFFDLDGTLRFSDPAPHIVFAEEAIRLGLEISLEARRRAAVWEHQYFGGSEEARADRAAFRDDSTAFWTNYSRRQLVELGASPVLAMEMATLLHGYMHEHYRPQDRLMPHVEQVLTVLKDAGLLLGVISNREQPFGEYLREIGLASYFDFSLAAGEVKSWKPDKAIFEHALCMTGMKAEETLYVGDNYYADVVGARNAGIRAILIDTEGVFDEPDCPVISSYHEFLGIFGHAQNADSIWSQPRANQEQTK